MTDLDAFDPWLIRTNFDDDEEWESVINEVSAPQRDSITDESFVANVRVVNDIRYANLSCNDLIRSLPNDYPSSLVFIADRITFGNEEHSILVVDFSRDSGDADDFQRVPSQTPIDHIRSFRALPSKIQVIENNLSIANMDFDEFADASDDNGVFREFPQ